MYLSFPTICMLCFSVGIIIHDIAKMTENLTQDYGTEIVLCISH